MHKVTNKFRYADTKDNKKQQDYVCRFAEEKNR